MPVCVLGVGNLAQSHGANVFFIFAHEEVLNFCASSYGEYEESSGEWVEGTAVADFPSFECASCEVDDIVGCHAGGFINEKDSVNFVIRWHGGWHC